MALLPTRQLHIDSFHSKFHGTPLQLFRYNSSIPLKTQTFHSNSKNSPRKSSFFAADKPDICLSTSYWFSKWNKPSRQNHPKPPQAVLNYRNSDNSGSGGSTMERIVEKLKKHGYIDGDVNEKKAKTPERVIEKGSVEDIFYVEEGNLPNSRGGFSKESPLGVEDVFRRNGQVRFPWEKPKREELENEKKWTARSKSRTHLAELTLPESELRRLRNLTFQIKSKVRVKGAGVTREIVDTIHDRWKTSEIVRVKVEGAPAINMRRMHEILEKSLYRGVSYEDPSVQLNKKMLKKNEIYIDSLPTATGNIRSSSIIAASSTLNMPNSDSNVEGEGKQKIEMTTEVESEDEVDKLLEGLGPRYAEWTGLDPLPADADMLPGIVLCALCLVTNLHSGYFLME